MELFQYGIFDLCVQDDPITEENGQATGRCKIPNVRNPAYVPVYIPKNTCPDPVNYDPRRNERVCKSNPSNSLPLSNEEYLLRRIRNGNRPLSNSYLLQTDADTGKYRTTIWTAAGTSNQPSTSKGIDLGVLPTAPPVTGTGGTALDASTLTQMRMAIAGRGSFSPLDVNNRRFDSITTIRRMGLAIISNPGNTQPCISCDLSGTSASIIVGQYKCTCNENMYVPVRGPFGFLWEQYSNGASYASPAVSADGRLIYVGSLTDILAIDTEAGNIIWRFSNPFFTDNFSLSNITIGSDGTLYFGGSQSYFFAVDGLRGTLKWHYTTGNNFNHFATKPCFNSSENIVYTVSNGPVATLYAFDLNGSIINTYTNSDLISNNSAQSPNVGPDGTVYFSYNGHLVALSSLLTFKWIANCGTIDGELNVNWYSPTIDLNGLIYVGSNNGTSKLYCFIDNGSSATLKWTYTAPSASLVFSPIIGPLGQIYVCVNPTVNIYCLLLSFSSNGSMTWGHEFESSNYFNYIFAGIGQNNTIFVTNIHDSGLIVLKDKGNSVKQVANLSNPSATSGVYGSLTLSPPVSGPGGSVYWCNGNVSSPAIFGAGYPVSVVLNSETAPVAPVFTPSFLPQNVTNTSQKIVIPSKYALKPSV